MNYLITRPTNVSVKHCWQTGITAGINGKEERWSIFNWPRLLLDNKYRLTQLEMERIRASLITGDSLWKVPVWPDVSVLTAQGGLGESSISADFANRHFYQGREAVLVDPDDYSNYEIVEIDTLADNQITTVDALAAIWPIGTLIIPLYEFKVAAGQTLNGLPLYYLDLALSFEEAFEEVPTYSYVIPDLGSAMDSYLDIDLFLHAPMSSTFECTFYRPYDYFQAIGLGVFFNRFDTGEVRINLSGKIICATQEEIWDVFKFFDAHQGRLSRFWVPTWNRDITPRSAIDSADTVIPVQLPGYETDWLPNNIIGRHLYIQFPDGSYTCRKIEDASDLTPSITLDSAIGVSVTEEQLSRLLISFLILSRFDQDVLEMDYSYHLTWVASASIAFAGLVEEILS